jgi:hypothetical protein
MSKGRITGECCTCKCEIVELVNDSVFGDGECNGCEYARYKSHSELFDALDYLLEQTVDMDLNYGVGLTEGEADARRIAHTAMAKFAKKTLPAEAGS